MPHCAKTPDSPEKIRRERARGSNEAALNSRSREEILSGMGGLIGTVCQAVENGLRAVSVVSY